MRTQDFTNRFRVDTDAFDTGDEVTTVALEENAVFVPVVVFVVFVPDAFEESVVLCLRTQY